MIQEYVVPNYYQHDLLFWCKSKNTINEQTQKKWGGNGSRLIIKEDGWTYLTTSRIFVSKENNVVIEKLPIDQIHINNDSFMYIAPDGMNFVVTFDTCATLNGFYPPKLYSQVGNPADQLFKKDELLISPDKNSAKLTFISSHTHQTIKGIDQYCFNINKEWITDKNNQYQVCTEDKGKSWFATRKIGEGKVMKRLAGSEEWIDFAI